MLLALLAIPVLAATLAWFLGRPWWNEAILVLVAVAHGLLTAGIWILDPAPLLGDHLALDALGRWFLTGTSVLNLATALYTVGYMERRKNPRKNRYDNRFTACMLLFLATMTLATFCRHFEWLWVAIEATTLASAPLIYFHRSRHSLEATWKYLIVCSVGLGLALLGTVFLGIAGSMAGVGGLDLDSLVAAGTRMDGTWVRLAFVFLLVGYGTKAGLAPLHAWLPDAHSEAPSPVSALLSGASLNCALLGILRGLSVAESAGVGDFARGLLVALGLASLAFAAVFIIGQRDFKRLLAYSSVEHMGIAALGIGIGGMATNGALLHTMGHTMAKGLLFLVSGNLLSAWHSKQIHEVRGALRHRPATGLLWLVGLFLVTGMPPSPLFVSELAILKGALDGGRTVLAIAYLAGMTVVFIGMAAAFLPMVLGERPSVTTRPGDDGRARRDTAWLIGPPAFLAVLAVSMGLGLPNVVTRCLADAAALVAGGAP